MKAVPARPRFLRLEGGSSISKSGLDEVDEPLQLRRCGKLDRIES
jgi:hypothetical protein